MDATFGIDAANESMTPRRAGRFTVHGSGQTALPGTFGIEIDPGYAFGSGSHASTRLALELLDDVVAPGSRVADIGCGSGVLSIAAASLGADVIAVDVDPHAVAATRHNSESNGVTDRVRVSEGSIEAANGTDIALINVTIDIHEAMGPSLTDPPATIVVAGMLDSQVERAVAAYHAHIVDRTDEGEWSGLVLHTN